MWVKQTSRWVSKANERAWILSDEISGASDNEGYWFYPEYPMLFMWAPSKIVKSSFWQKLPICLFISVAREVFFCCRARGGAFRQILGIKRSRRQISTSEGFDRILDMVLFKTRAKLVLDAFEMNFSTWYWAAPISSNTVSAEGSGAFLTGSDMFKFCMPCVSPDDWPVPSGMSTFKGCDGGGLEKWACTSGRCRQWGQVKDFLKTGTCQMKISTKLAPIGFVSAVDFHKTVVAVLLGRSSLTPNLKGVF